MIFEPKPGMKIGLSGDLIEFIPLEKSGPASVFIYAEVGKEGTVYKVLKNNSYYALKVFYPGYQDKRLLKNTQQINQFKEFNGLRVADRTLITKNLYPDVVNKYPELNYSILMPWIQGDLWGNIIANGNLNGKTGFYKVARLLVQVLCGLEKNGIAHCDLSNNNFIIEENFSKIELIDIEDMYAPDMPRPIPNISFGTPGYRTKWIAERGLWGSDSDRFACAILCSEILTWHNNEIRKNKSGDTSFFNEEEIGESSERYNLMRSCLERINPKVAVLFEQAWASKKMDQCPSTCDWLNALEEVNQSSKVTILSQSADSIKDTIEDTKPFKKPLIGNEEAVSGVPSKLVVNPSTLNFGIIHQNEVSAHLIIKNTGGSVLTGNVIPSSWIEPSQSKFLIQPGDQRVITIKLRSTFPKPSHGFEYRTPNALVIESNAGSEVVGAVYSLPKPPFYKSWWGIWGIFVIGMCCMFTLLGGSGSAIISPSFLPFLWTQTPTRTPTSPPTITSTPTSTPNIRETSVYSAKQTSTAKIINTEAALNSCANVYASFIVPNYDVKFCDRYDDNKNGWYVGITDDQWGHQRQQVFNGKLTWDYEAATGLVSWDTIEKLRVYDFELTVQIQRRSGPEYSACYGVIFREGSMGFYLFLVCDDGTYEVALSYDDGWVILIPWTDSDAIKPGQINRLSVVGQGSDFRLFINNELVSSFNDDTLKSGYIGLAIQLNEADSAVFDFDNLVVAIP
jgi:serine/threonine protein kinase